MGTRANIAVYQPATGSFKQIYVHWDGYPEHTGKVLLENYNSQELANKLIELGDLSQIGPKLEAPAGVHHSYNDPAKDTCIAYHRDRCERLKIRDVSVPELDNDYLYIYMPSDDETTWDWYVRSDSRDEVRLTQVLKS